MAKFDDIIEYMVKVEYLLELVDELLMDAYFDEASKCYRVPEGVIDQIHDHMVNELGDD